LGLREKPRAISFADPTKQGKKALKTPVWGRSAETFPIRKGLRGPIRITFSGILANRETVKIP